MIKISPELEIPGSVIVDRDWNGREIKMITYPDSHGYTGFSITALEARFFVFGSLLKTVSAGNASDIFSKWKPIMDTILKKISNLMKEEKRSGIYIDEVVTPEIEEMLI